MTRYLIETHQGSRNIKADDWRISGDGHWFRRGGRKIAFFPHSNILAIGLKKKTQKP